MELNESFESQINRSDYKILIVDDVMSNVLLLKILLTNEKFQVCTANNGNMCIEQAKKEKPDLILLDVMMPDISGFDTAVILKKDPETLDIPIIFLTALNNPSDLVKGFQVGANDFLTKPFNKEELVMRVPAFTYGQHTYGAQSGCQCGLSRNCGRGDFQFVG